ncbi:hypothetical protein HDU93_009918, partial [Gonapodya sp. JEL0774]
MRTVRGGLDQDLVTAVCIYSEALEDWDVVTAVGLGQMYEKRLGGLTRDASKAIEKYELAGSWEARARLPSSITIPRSHTGRVALVSRCLATAAGGAVGKEEGKREYRLRRALFNVPGSEDRKLAASLRIGADSVVFDLEDGVAYHRKAEAREKVYKALETFDLGKSEKAVRINSVGSGLEVDDLNAVLPSPNLQAIVIPKCQTADDVRFVAGMVDRVAPES